MKHVRLEPRVVIVRISENVHKLCVGSELTSGYNSRMDVNRLVREYLEGSNLMQIATCAKNIPWVCTVCFAVDEKLNVYWFSSHETRHSQEIILNSRVAVAVVQPHTLGNPVRGLQFSGLASELKNPDEIRHSLSCNAKRYGVTAQKTRALQAELESGQAKYGIYRIKPDSFLLYDTLNFPKSPQQKLDLNDTLI